MARRRLTEQQRARIAAIQERRRETAQQRADVALQSSDGEHYLAGRVITRHGRNLVVADDQHNLRHCLFRQNIGELVCGDSVVWQPTQDGEGVVVAMQERRSALSRPDYSGREKPLAANITQVVVVLAPEPPPTGYLLDQYLIAAELIGVKAAVALNKSDLLDEADLQDFQARFAHYPGLGYPLFNISAKIEHGLHALVDHLADETSILVGQSGVGKSSLIRALIPDQDVQVGRLSDATGLGRHTTSSTTLYRLPDGGELIDSPGVRSFRISPADRDELERCFPEFRPHLGHCRFSNCAHESEPDCAIIAAHERGEIHSERLQSFRQLATELSTRPNS